MFYHVLFFFLLLFFNSLKRFNLSKRAKSSRYFILRTAVFFLGLFSFYEYQRKNYREITVQEITRSHVFISRAELRASTYNRPFNGFFFFWHEQLREFRRLRWNERIKISLKVICGKLTKIQLLRVAEFFWRFYGGFQLCRALIRRITFSRGMFTNSKMRFADYWWSKPLTKGKISLREWTF